MSLSFSPESMGILRGSHLISAISCRRDVHYRELTDGRNGLEMMELMREGRVGCVMGFLGRLGNVGVVGGGDVGWGGRGV